MHAHIYPHTSSHPSSWCFDKRGVLTAWSNKPGSVGSVVTKETRNISGILMKHKMCLTCNWIIKVFQANIFFSPLLSFVVIQAQNETVSLLSCGDQTAVENSPTSKMEACQELIRLALIVIAAWFLLMLVIFHAVKHEEMNAFGHILMHQLRLMAISNDNHLTNEADLWQFCGGQIAFWNGFCSSKVLSKRVLIKRLHQCFLEKYQLETSFYFYYTALDIRHHTVSNCVNSAY